MKQYDRTAAAVQVFRLFNMLTVGRCSERRLFRHLTNHIFSQSLISKMHNRWVSSFLTKYWKFYVDLRYAGKNWLKISCSLANCSSIGCGTSFLLQRGWLLLAADVFTKIPRISGTLIRTFSNSIFSKVMKQCDGTSVGQFFRLFNMSTVARCSETCLFWHLTNQILGSL